MRRVTAWATCPTGRTPDNALTSKQAAKRLAYFVGGGRAFVRRLGDCGGAAGYRMSQRNLARSAGIGSRVREKRLTEERRAARRHRSSDARNRGRRRDRVDCDTGRCERTAEANELRKLSHVDGNALP